LRKKKTFDQVNSPSPLPYPDQPVNPGSTEFIINRKREVCEKVNIGDNANQTKVADFTDSKSPRRICAAKLTTTSSILDRILRLGVALRFALFFTKSFIAFPIHKRELPGGYKSMLAAIGSA
jgi:hypothetical protein